MREYMSGRLFGIDAPLFDASESARRRDAGIARASAKREREGMVLQARGIALSIAARCGTVTSDDVAAMMTAMGLDYSALGNAAGAVFRDPAFEDTQQTRKSERVSGHRRKMTVWRLKGAGEKETRARISYGGGA